MNRGYGLCGDEVGRTVKEIDIPGRQPIRLERVVFDVNGTLTDRGTLIDGVAERIQLLRHELDVLLASADTFETLDEVVQVLDVPAHRAGSAEEKLVLIESLGASHTAHVGNGSNDVLALASAALGIAVLGAEGLSAAAFGAADVICLCACDAIDLLLDARAVTATLRS
jgi:soluble P-type ATPase